MKIRELTPTFLKIETPDRYAMTDALAGADGVQFRCPVPSCGHYVTCWFNHVGQDVYPRPGRWKPQGTGYDDLTFVPWDGHTESVFLQSGCMAHFLVVNGEVKLV